jgi:hypothetical protein
MAKSRRNLSGILRIGVNFCPEGRGKHLATKNVEQAGTVSLLQLVYNVDSNALSPEK